MEPGGTGGVGAGMGIPPPASIPPTLGHLCHVSPPQRWTRGGEKSQCSGPVRGLSPWVPATQEGAAFSARARTSWEVATQIPPPRSIRLLLAWVQTWLQKAMSEGPYPAAREKGSERAVLGGWESREPQSLAGKHLPTGRAGPALQQAQRCCTMALALKQRGEGKPNLSIQLKAPGE